MIEDDGNIIKLPWRSGTQVGRTLYIDTDTKDPTNLFGLVDDADTADHIVKIHNWWLDLTIEDERAWGQWKADHSTDDAALERAVRALRAQIRHAVVEPHCGDPIDIDVDEEDLFPWMVAIVVRALNDRDACS